jgi:PKD repeat protein
MKTIKKIGMRCFISTSQMKYAFFALTILSLTLVSCQKKHSYKACCTANKTTVANNEEIIFSNCSTVDGKTYLDNSIWDLGDGTSAYWSKGNEDVTHTYSKSGQYIVTQTIGEKENDSEYKMTIIVQ